MGMVAVGCGGSTTNDATGTTQARGAQQGTVVKDEGKPKPGGTVTYGLEADSDGFNPTVNRWAISGVMVGLAVYDPIAAYNDKVEAKPYLAEAITPNADYTQWTIKLRSGVKFSNGTPLTSDAIVKLFDAHLKSPLTKPVFSDLKDYSATDDLTVVFNMKSPWVVFPTTLTAQTGVVPEPGSLSDTGAAPIGSGPFVQTEWVKEASWKGKKNPTYWRKDKDGTQLPYLDNLEFRPIADQESRNKSLQGGTLNMMHTSDTKGIKLFREEAAAGKVQMIEDNGEGEEGFIIMNQAKAPFDSVDARRALAYATDATAYGQDTNEGILEPADGVFKKNSPWYAPSKNYPTYNLDEAKKLVEKYKTEHGGQPPTFELGVGANSQTEAVYLQSVWQEAGFVVTVKDNNQASFVLDAVTGKYQANLWRQFGAPDPDADLIWWLSDNAKDPATGQVAAEGGLTLNIARQNSACVDKAVKASRTTPELAGRKKAYADLQQCFADEVPYVWLDHSVWAVIAANNVRGITNGPLPDGEASLPIGGAGDFGGVTRLTQTWLAS